MEIPSAILASKQRITRNNTHSRAHSLNEAEVNISLREIKDLKERNDFVRIVIDYLDVEVSLRYKPESSKTFCNVYAHDLCALAGVYLPRVWWNEDAIRKLRNGQQVNPVYEESVIELNTSSITQWLETYGNQFGWCKANNWNLFQRNIKNEGTIGLVIGIHGIDNSNHIAIAYSNNAFLKKIRFTDAGRQLHKEYFKKWWKKFEKSVFWYFTF